MSDRAIEPEVLPPAGERRLPPESPGSLAIKGLVVRLVVNAFALWAASIVIPGIDTDGILPLFLAALVLGVLNAVLRPILIFFTLPLNLLTLGLFTFVINALMLRLTGAFVDGFHVAGFWSAFFGALVLGLVSFLLSFFLSDRGRFETITVEVRTGGGRGGRIARF